MQVELDLNIHYPEYELVLDKVEHYYNLPLINFKYDNDILAIYIFGPYMIITSMILVIS